MNTHSKPLILAIVCLAVLAINLDTTIVNVALPSIADQLGAGTRGLQWVVDGYNLAFAGLVLAAGSLSDRYGRRPALIVGLLAFAATSVIGAEVGSIGWLVTLRFAMGASAALIYPTTLSIISNAFRERGQRAMALGIWGAVTGVGVAAGPVVGGALLQHFYWGSVLWALVPVAVLTAVAAFVVVPESRDASVPPIDRQGLLVSVVMLALLTYTVIEAPARGWHSAATLGGFAGTLVLVALFVLVERRAAHPMLDLSLFADRRFSAASGSVMVAFFSLFGFIFLITQFFQLIRGYDALSTGVRILPVAVSIAGASVVGGLLAPRIGTKVVVASGLAVLASSFLWISQVAPDTSYWAVIVPEMVLMGVGMGLISTPATNSILLVLPPSRVGVGSAVNDATRELGGTLGVAVVGSVFASVYGHHLAQSAFASLGRGPLDQASGSVNVAAGMAQGSPELGQALHSSFMSGLHTGSFVVGVLCLAAALAALLALPGRRALTLGSAPCSEPSSSSSPMPSVAG